MSEFVAFDKIPRLRRGCTITEKIDGTNAQIYFPDDGDGSMFVGSRNRWITPADDNFGFARWAQENYEELTKLGPGRHYGEWWGAGIQRRYGLTEKRFSLFKTSRWCDESGNPLPTLPVCCSVVPILHHGTFSDTAVSMCLDTLRHQGSLAAPGFMNPEGIVVYHHASRTLHKVTIGDDGHKEGRAA